MEATVIHYYVIRRGNRYLTATGNYSPDVFSALRFTGYTDAVYAVVSTEEEVRGIVLSEDEA